jgi:hypothetical protein
MLSFLAMIFTLRVGLGATPVDRAAISLRDEALVVAEQVAQRKERDAIPRPVPMAIVARPPGFHRLSREDWKRLVSEAFSNETISTAAMWIATQPVHVSMSGRKFFVSLRFATP